MKNISAKPKKNKRESKHIKMKSGWLTVGSGGFDTDLIEDDGLFGGIVFVAVSVELLEVIGLAGCDKLCSGAWNV